MAQNLAVVLMGTNVAAWWELGRLTFTEHCSARCRLQAYGSLQWGAATCHLGGCCHANVPIVAAFYAGHTYTALVGRKA